MNCECVHCRNNKPFEMPETIIEATKAGSLALFCGAGISTEKKTVLPSSFYTNIKAELKLTDDSIPFCDLMQAYCDQPNGRRKFIKAITERFEYIHSFPELEDEATSFHNELAEIYQINTIITTNWDTYFETKCNAIPITSPKDFSLIDESSRFVLKLHGSISNISSIVATTKDYETCYKQLLHGSVGAELKRVLTQKTVVFVGFSFGDSDFEQILNYLQEEQEEYMPHIFIVSIDPNFVLKYANIKATLITTDGTFFLHQLKKILCERKLLVNLNSRPIVSNALDKLISIHKKTAKISMFDNPCVIYALAYQDGIIHAFERYFQLYKTGQYNSPQHIESSYCGYDGLISRYKKARNYWNVAYYEGYQRGLLFIASCEYDPRNNDKFPMFYLPLIYRDILTFKELKEELIHIPISSLYYKYAVKVCKLYKSRELVVHHPPY